jgi:hypothetical protein
MRRLLLLSLSVVVLVVACTDEDASDVVVESSSSSTTATTAVEEPESTFEGATAPTSIASSATTGTGAVALLTDVTVEDGAVVFTFSNEVPGIAAEYVQPPILEDASGEEIAVDGTAYLHVRMEPASGVDLSGEEFVETYTGPTRIPGTGTGPIVEVVRTGDFEAVLGWVIGLDGEQPYLLDVEGLTARVYFST